MMANSEVKAIIEKMLNDDRKVVNGEPETNWTVLVNNKIFSRAVPVPRDCSKTYEENWDDALMCQLIYLKEFVATSINLGLGIPPLNEEGSVVALAVYNAATYSDVDNCQFVIPSAFDCAQEFYRLILQNK